MKAKAPDAVNVSIPDEAGPLRTEDVASAQALLELLPNPAMWIGPTHQVRWMNSAARQLYGEGPGTCYALSHGRDQPCSLSGEQCPLEGATASGHPLTVTHAHTHADGTTGLHQVVGLPLADGGLIELHLDLGGGVALDPVTGAYRREFWSAIATRMRDLLERLGQPYGVLFVDVDDFKGCNDRFGHAFGDEVLKQVAAAIRHAVRTSDTVGRFGGDEVVVFVPHTDASGLLDVAERLWLAVRGTAILHGSGSQQVTVSVGAHWARPSEPLDQAIAAADRAMYAAKGAGRDRIALR